MPIEIYNDEMTNLYSIYGYKFVINHTDKSIKIENGDIFYYKELSIQTGGHKEQYLQVVMA